LKSLPSDNPVTAIVDFIKVRPIGSKNKQLIQRDLEAFQNIVSKIQEKEYDGLIKTLKEEDC
jgi:hypothetical protein